MVSDLDRCPQSCPQIQVTRLRTLFAIFGALLPENHEGSLGTSGDLLSGPRKWSEVLLGPVGRHHGGNLHLQMHLQCICMHALWTFEWIRIAQLPSTPGASICCQVLSTCTAHADGCQHMLKMEADHRQPSPSVGTSGDLICGPETDRDHWSGTGATVVNRGGTRITMVDRSDLGAFRMIVAAWVGGRGAPPGP